MLIYRVFVFVAYISLMGLSSSSVASERPLLITTKKSNDRTEVVIQSNAFIVAIRSPSGISQATIERVGPNWPENVTLRLHLQGLEGFKAANGEVTLHATVPSRSSDPPYQLWLNDRSDETLDSKSAYWMPIRIIEPVGAPDDSIPRPDRIFELKLPAALFDDNPSSITIGWIDFYR